MIRRKVEQRARYLLSLDDTSERLALAFALGVFLTLTPFVGLPTILGLTIAFLFGLNRAALLFGLFVNNPCTLVPYYAAASYLGNRLIGLPSGLSLPHVSWSQPWHAEFWLQLTHQGRSLAALALGSAILAVLCAGISYPLALYAIRRGRATLGYKSTP
jgi:uncharacterized protein (DUF2062 family)